MEDLVYPVILSGGSGTRLWPLSRRLQPKQFLCLGGETNLFNQTLARVYAEPFSPPVIVCNCEHRFLVAETLRQLDINPHKIILEPVSRNTAPAIAAAVLHLARKNPDVLILVLPSDHVITDTKAFHHAIKAAREVALEGKLVTFGIMPDHPETGYGYIRQGSPFGDSGWHVDKFIEKPGQTEANAYVTESGYFWNSGILLFQAQTFLSELENFHPDIVKSVDKAESNGEQDLNFLWLNRKILETTPSISIDYAVMEKTSRAAVIPLDAGWNDMGSWESLWKYGNADDSGNIVEGRAVLVDSHENYVRSEKPLVTMLGVRGLAVISTDDAVLVLPKERAQEVADIVTAVKALGHEEANIHTQVYRPWGQYKVLEDGDGFLVKRVVVNSGAKLSLQYHNHRAEHWVIVAGRAQVTNGENTFELGPNQSTFIPLGTAHRLENPGDEPLSLIEVQTGDYISEDDIVRLDDTYGRS